MHGFDYSIPHFVTRVQGTRIVVTPDLISEVLHVPRVEFANYLDCERLRTRSKDELSFCFCETPSFWGNCQNTHCLSFATGLRFLNMVMTFVLHPLSHYNSITEFHAWFLLSLLEGLIIDFPSHFILSLIDVYRDTTTRDKLIFPLAVTWILHHFSISYLESTHFSVMCAINAATVRRSKTQLRLKRPRTETSIPPASSAPSISTPSSLTGSVTLKAVQCMDARLNTLSDELCQLNTRVNCIAWQQARLGGFVESFSPSLEASKDEDDDGDFDDDDDDKDSSDDDEMTAWVTYPLSFVTKRGSSFGMRVVMYLGEELA